MRRTKHTTKHFVELEVSVDWNFTPGCRGSRDSLCGIRGAGPPLEPDDPPEIEIVKVYDSKDTELEMDDKILASLEQEIWEHISSVECDQEPPEDE